MGRHETARTEAALAAVTDELRAANERLATIGVAVVALLEGAELLTSDEVAPLAGMIRDGLDR